MNPVTRALIISVVAGLIGLPAFQYGEFLFFMVRSGRTDFRATYVAGHMLRSGKPLYDLELQKEEQDRLVSPEQIALPFNHPAYEALIYAPLSYFSYFWAYWAWFTVNLLLLCAMRWVLRTELISLDAIARGLSFAAIAAFVPFGATLMNGQDSLLCALLFAIAFALLRSEDREFHAGLVLGLAAFRFQILVPVLLCFLCWKRRKLVLGALSAAFPAAFLSIAIAGFRPYVRILLEFAGQYSDLPTLVSHMPNLRGLIISLGGHSWMVAFASVLILALTVTVGRSIDDKRMQLALAICSSALVSYHGLMHDLALIFVACALLLTELSTVRLAVLGIVFVSPLLLFFTQQHVYLAVIGPLVLWSYLVSSGFRFAKLGSAGHIKYVNAPPPALAAVTMISKD